jgi:hypothetical protein
MAITVTNIISRKAGRDGGDHSVHCDRRDYDN